MPFIYYSALLLILNFWNGNKVRKNGKKLKKFKFFWFHPHPLLANICKKLYLPQSQNVATTEYTECQAVCPVVRIGSPLPLTREGVLLPPFWVQGRRHTRSPGRGWGHPIPTKGQTLWYSTYVYYNPFTVASLTVLAANFLTAIST